MPSKAETVLMALVTALATIPDARVLRNAVVPERIGDDGLVIVRDGEPGSPEQALGGFSGAYYTHTIEIEIFAEHGDDAIRDQRFDALLVAIGAVLETYPTLGGLVFGMTVGRPEGVTEPVLGSAAIKTGTLHLVVEYETPTPLG